MEADLDLITIAQADDLEKLLSACVLQAYETLTAITNIWDAQTGTHAVPPQQMQALILALESFLEQACVAKRQIYDFEISRTGEATYRDGGACGRVAL